MSDLQILPPPIPNFTKEQEIELLAQSFGINDKIVSRLLEKYSNEVTSLKDYQGNFLLARAIQMNDGEAVSFFLERGQDVHQALSSSNPKTIFEYAKEMSHYNDREPFAWNAINNFTQVKENCPLKIMTHIDVRNLQSPNYDGDLIKLYHGTKSSTSEHSLKYLVEEIVSTGIKEVSNTPTLSTVPIGQFFSADSIGFCYSIPKKLVCFDNEDKPDAIVWIDTKSNIARIINKEKTLLFSEHKAEAFYRPIFITKEVYSTYGKTEGNFEKSCVPLSQKQIELMTQIREKLTNSPINLSHSVSKVEEMRAKFLKSSTNSFTP